MTGKWSGYGAQSKPVLHEKAKTTKKFVLRLVYVEPRSLRVLAIKRCKHFELGGDKRRGHMIYFSSSSFVLL